MNRYQFTVHQNVSSISEEDVGAYVRRAGIVVTPYGIVIVESMSQAERPHSYYEFVWQGRRHIWSERKGRTARGLAIMAGKLVRGVVEEEQQSDSL